MVAAGLTWGLDSILLARVASGTDNGVRLAAVLTYVGVDGSYTLARALGAAALVFSYVAMLLGLVRPTPSPARGALGAVHRQVGAVTVALVAAHAAVPYTSSVPPYGGWRTALVPFGQPVSWGIRAASWESLGILAFYLLLVTGPTYYLFGSRRRAWTAGHRLIVAIYALSVAHAFLLGTDFVVAGPLRLALLGAQVPLLLLLARRLMAPGTVATRPFRRIAAVLTAAASAGMAVLTVLAATGHYAHGMRL